MSEKLTPLFMFIVVTTAPFLINSLNENRANEKTIKELTTKLNEKTNELNLKNVELSMAKNDLDDSHEVIGTLFEASLDLTDKYNELKKLKCKGKR